MQINSIVLLLLIIIFAGAPAHGVPTMPKPASPSPQAVQENARETEDDEQQAPADRVEVRPETTDEEIASRLQRILEATDWYDNPQVSVEEGVAFLSGETESEDLKTWAGNLARNTRDVVAVVNQIDIKAPPMWDLSPALKSLKSLWFSFLRTFPLVLFGLVVLVIAWFAALGTTQILRVRFSTKDNLNRLLREVIARAIGMGVFLLGLYFVLLVSGLARLAVTVLGGKGLIGLVIGIAFRDITENFLASIFLSIQRPFHTGDLIEVDNITGYVQKLSVRTTVLMTQDGNHVQVPNSTVYKSNIRNFTSNPYRRASFCTTIGYNDTISKAQDIALQVLKHHPVVLAEPEPWVLVDELRDDRVKLKIYFWFDGEKHSIFKVRSSVIRLVKKAFQDNGITMPDEPKKFYIASDKPLQLEADGEIEHHLPGTESPSTEDDDKEKPAHQGSPGGRRESDTVSTAAEGGLSSEKETVDKQSSRARIPEEGDDLLQ